MRSPVRLERRLEQPKWLNWVVPLASLVAALILGAIVLWITGKNPFDVYQRIFERGFAGKRAFSGALEMATPLAFTGLCAAVAFRMGLVNIGGEGQFYMGAVGASYVGISLGGLPTGITIALMCLGGMVFGSVYAAIVVINLDHDAIDLEAERATPLLPLQAALDRLLLASEPFNVAVDREAALAQPLQRFPLRAEADPFAGAYAVGPEREWPLGGEARVELTQRPCCRIARVHEGRLAVAGTALVEALEALQ